MSDQNSQLTESQIEATRKEFHAHIASLQGYGPEPFWVSFGKDGKYYYDGVRAMWLGWLAHAESIQAELSALRNLASVARSVYTSGHLNEALLEYENLEDSLDALDALEVRNAE